MTPDRTATGPIVGDAAGLAVELSAMGLSCMIEAHERLAVIVPTGTTPDLSDPTVRREIQSLAVAHGFTHVALDLGA